MGLCNISLGWAAGILVVIIIVLVALYVADKISDDVMLYGGLGSFFVFFLLCIVKYARCDNNEDDNDKNE